MQLKFVSGEPPTSSRARADLAGSGGVQLQGGGVSIASSAEYTEGGTPHNLGQLDLTQLRPRFSRTRTRTSDGNEMLLIRLEKLKGPTL